ncbi:hypothetical protein A3C60_00775 [Candidatus Nomurabacteria bacterium RIFCSPHIGHO2_02_FULL_37_45]|uniref:DUF5050 domain-containing protein n=2 Tax=Candidatus Nomuraibacteriota TaxID=1752729 RepID=A0A1F6Y5X8_9BACT|nr:MAG: hypothetical protein A3C60_00775 [Candidatus Nomurabacteria bacterium RIFCSPHIGHO2_02_FULL_37_45]OGI78896.1 MAG: hypothetical protein A3F19_03220 [Candidatus Nomurabacteria bacterium RIFCSPHIGHO2_12_FULL_37_29]OGI85474.1 MAG: hypothetical protein A3A92_01090 [Candidatus Nomurabacteria bacterium RIFCSPLOWO2_01_FULL_37_49]OGJ01752.1 MAG: hypothetical protein A3G98_00040 [Candidatus Nomurabacteria bacterium RIFCSPLOWO2_12_FULL_37_8]
MSKRNFILLIIILILVVIAFVVFLYSRPGTNTPTDNGDQGTNFISRFNPFTKNTPPPTATPPTNIGEDDTNTIKEIPKLVKVSSMPIAGFIVFVKERLKDIPVAPPTPETEQGLPPLKTAKPTPPLTEFVGALRYVERATGNIYQTFVDKIIERKFSTTIIPKIYEAYFGNRGESVVMRYLKENDKTIETFVGTLPKEYLGADTTANNEIKGYFLPDNVKDVSVSPNGLKVFYLFETVDKIVGTTLNLSDGKKVQVFDSPFTEWLSGWASDKTITLTTKPSANIPGYVYTLSLDKKNLLKTLGDINGLTTLASPDGKLILYSDRSLSSYIYHTDSRNVDSLGIKTLPEKCVWGKGNDVVYCAVPKFADLGQYPDSWYQGEVSFNDQLWKVDIKTGNTTMISDPVTVVDGEEIDGIKLALDQGENYLFFVNKKDSFLWKLELK